MVNALQTSRSFIIALLLPKMNARSASGNFLLSFLLLPIRTQHFSAPGSLIESCLAKSSGMESSKVNPEEKKKKKEKKTPALTFK